MHVHHIGPEGWGTLLREVVTGHHQFMKASTTTYYGGGRDREEVAEATPMVRVATCQLASPVEQASPCCRDFCSTALITFDLNYLHLCLLCVAHDASSS